MLVTRSNRKYKDRAFGLNHPHRVVSGCLSICLLSVSAALLANPVGGDVVGGSANIDYGTTTVITQHSNSAIINWQDFSIQEHETTQFVQPSSKSVILNRVTGSNASQIMGRLNSNGIVFLVNPNGIVFGKNAVVDVGGLVASTANISNQHFMEGNYRFDDAPAGSVITNLGHITVADQGLAALVAPEVQNLGYIKANLGHVVLASGKAFTLDLYGDGMINVDATALVKNGAVSNAGTIEAHGGTVVMSAVAADALMESVINMSGYIEAGAVSSNNGKVVLMGGAHTSVAVSGTINVSGKQSHEKGGSVNITATDVLLNHASTINADGYLGGGLVHIGGEYQGSGTLPHADSVFMQEGATISASAKHKGNGGLVVLWADEATYFYGSIYAQGGIYGGDGGIIETSAHAMLDVAGSHVDAHAPHGAHGTWLIDPLNITVDNSLAATISGVLNHATTPTNVTITTNSSGADEGDITFVNTTAISWDKTTAFTALANRDIIFNAVGNPIVLSNTGKGTINLRADSDALAPATTFGTVTFTSGRIESTGMGNVNVYYNPVAFTSPVNPYNASITGNATVRQYMLVYDNANQANHSINTIAMNSAIWNRSYALAESINSIALTAPIGNATTAFSGIFSGLNSVALDGSNYTISDLILGGSQRYAGLFGNVSGVNARVQDITLITPTITSSYASTNGAVGAVAGIVQGGATLEGDFEVISNGTTLIQGLRNVGGIIGLLGSTSHVESGSTFTTSLTSGTFKVQNISGSTGINIGGLFGNVASSASTFAPSTLVNHATVIATHTISAGIGGIFGRFEKAGLSVASNMSNYGDITFESMAAINVSRMGGIAGLVAGDSVFSGALFNSGNIGSTPGIATLSNVGGLVGEITAGSFSGSMTNAGNVTGTNSVGGLIGAISGLTSVITASTNDFKITAPIHVSGRTSVGGLVGSFGASAIFARKTNASTFEGMTVIGSSNSIGGLFGAVTGATLSSADFANAIDTIFINNAAIILTGSGSKTGVGGIFGSFSKTGLSVNANMQNNGDISFVTVASSKTGGIAGSISGGLLGSTFNGNMLNTGSITAGPNTGGLLGETSGGIFTGIMNSAANVTGGDSTGGLIGRVTLAVITGDKDFNLNAGIIRASGGSGVGGLIGSIDDGTVFDRGGASLIQTAAGVEVIGNGNGIGGLFGEITESATTLFNPTPVAGLINRANITVTAGGGALRAGGIIGRFLNTYQIGTQAISSNMTNYGDIALAGGITTGMGGIAGRIAGSHFSGSLINYGSISGASLTGGIVGYLQGSLTGSSVNYGAVIGSSDTGGIVGTMQNNARLMRASFLGSVQGDSNIGGIVGSLTGGTLDQAYNNTQAVTGATHVGGIVGFLGAGTSISNVFFGGTLTGTHTVGGIVGLNQGTINNALSVGTITPGATLTGAMVGDNAGSILNSFYDTRAISNNVGTGASGGTGYNNSLLLEGPALYTNAGWDFISIWSTSLGHYPVLQFCTTNCAVQLRVTPPQPINTLTNQDLTAIKQIEHTNQTENMLDSEELNVPVNHIVADNASVIEQHNMPIHINGTQKEVLVQVLNFFPNTQYLTAPEQTLYETAHLKTITSAITDYYAHQHVPTQDSYHPTSADAY